MQAASLLDKPYIDYFSTSFPFQPRSENFNPHDFTFAYLLQMKKNVKTNIKEKIISNILIKK